MKEGQGIRLTAYEREQVEKAGAYMDAHLHEALTAGEMALQWDLSGYKLKAGFVQLYGKSFAAWLKERRLEKAKELLLTTNKIIYEIALDCGYRDVSAFVRAFRNCYGHTPNVFRKK
jgi:AraC-like DNA-binding protein